MLSSDRKESDMSSLTKLVCTVILVSGSLASLMAESAQPAANIPQARVLAPERPDVNVRVIVEPGVAKDNMPEKAHGYLTRKGAGNGQREGAEDPGPPQGETGNGQGPSASNRAGNPSATNGPNRASAGKGLHKLSWPATHSSVKGCTP